MDKYIYFREDCPQSENNRKSTVISKHPSRNRVRMKKITAFILLFQPARSIVLN